MTAPGSVTVSVDAGVATIAFGNPGRYNAFTRAMLESTMQALAEVERDAAVRVVVLRGQGGHFSAGLNIAELGVVDDDEAMQRRFVQLEDQVAALTRPTVAAVDGYCLGGGMQLALACDIRVATRRAQMAITPAKLGVIYPASSVERVVRAVGSAWARYLLLSAEKVSAEQAHGIGLIQELVTVEDLDRRVSSLTEKMVGHSARTMIAAKQMIAGAAAGGVEPAVDAYWREGTNADLEKGLTAFLRRERPDFRAEPWPAL